MSMFIYDLEVFKADWIVIFKNVANGEYTIRKNKCYFIEEGGK